MIPSEMRAGDAPTNDENSDYDHMERLRYVDTEVTQEEKTLLSNVLAAALPGLERLLGDDRHDILKGKMRYNAVGVSFNGGRDDKVRHDICIRPPLYPSFEPYFPACANRSSRRHRKDTHPVWHLETGRHRFLLRLQLRKSYALSNDSHSLLTSF